MLRDVSDETELHALEWLTTWVGGEGLMRSVGVRGGLRMAVDWAGQRQEVLISGQRHPSGYPTSDELTLLV